jgi:cyclase
MRTVAPGVYLENRYPAVQLGAIASDSEILLIDTPLRSEDSREWTSALSSHGEPRFVVMLDHHPDRALGGRSYDLPLLAHDLTRDVMSGWPDAFKGGARPIGAESDRLKRITGVAKAVPEVTFAESIVVHVGRRQAELLHRPGPLAGSIWVELAQPKVLFIGDLVMLNEPPFFGDCVIDSWLVSLSDLAGRRWKDHTLVSGRDGVVGRESLRAMARLLERVEGRLARIGGRGAAAEGCAALAAQLVRGYRLSGARREQALTRLQLGLSRLHARLYLSES